MFFQTLSGTSLVENCDSRLNPNVSSLPIRISIYFQCLFAILLALGRTSSREITLSNFLLQASSLSVMAAAFISSDISQAIIASHFSVMLSMCRNTPFDFGREFLQSRPGLKTVTRILLLDVVFRPISLCFNYRLWKRVRNLQMTGSSCESAVKWVFFGKRLEIDMSGTTVAFTLAIFDIGWELTRVVGEILRIWTLCENEEVTIARQIGFDSRMWWIKQVYIKARRVFTAEMEYDGWDWDFICRWTRRISQLQKSVICGYVIWTVETMVDINGPIVDEVRWTFWPLFAIGNMLGMFSMFAIRYLTFIPFRGIIAVIALFALSIFSVICFIACLTITGMPLYYLGGYINWKLGREPFNLLERINLEDALRGEPQLLGIYVSLAASVGVFVFQMILNGVRWTLQEKDQAFEEVYTLRNGEI